MSIVAGTNMTEAELAKHNARARAQGQADAVKIQAQWDKVDKEKSEKRKARIIGAARSVAKWASRPSHKTHIRIARTGGAYAHEVPRMDSMLPQMKQRANSSRFINSFQMGNNFTMGHGFLKTKRNKK